MAHTTILGLDLGTKTGWAVLDSIGNRVASGVWVAVTRKGRKTIPDDHPGRRFTSYRTHVAETCARYHVTDVAYEAVHGHGPSGVKVAHLWGAWEGLTLQVADTLSLPCMPIWTGTVKKTAAHGRATKNEMLRAARDRWAYNPHDDNEADALWVAETCRKQQVAQQTHLLLREGNLR